MSGQMPICISFDDGFWEQLIWDEDLSDTTIGVRNAKGETVWEFSVHSIVLRRRSQFFNQLNFKFGETIFFDNVNILVLKKFIKYLYVGDIYVETWKEIVDFLGLALEYEVDSLYVDLELSLLKFVRLINACELLEVARRFGLEKLEKACLDIIVRGAAIIFGTGGFQGLSEETLQLIIQDSRLNVSREIDVILYLICWAKSVSFSKAKKLNSEELYDQIKTLLKSVRFDKIDAEDQKLIPDGLRSLVFPAAQTPSYYSAQAQPQATSPVKPDPKRILKPREPSKELCLLANYAELNLRPAAPHNAITWIKTDAVEQLVLRFSVTMPIFLGGFLMHYRLVGTGAARIIIRPANKTGVVEADSPVFPLKHKLCEHRFSNELLAKDNYVALCYEPDTPVLLKPGDECSVYLALAGATVFEMPRVNLPYTSIRSDEGPTFRLHLDTVTAVKKIHFLSACGRCIVNAID